jgi:uncharacterized protein YcbK (DUF882 family)
LLSCERKQDRFDAKGRLPYKARTGSEVRREFCLKAAATRASTWGRRSVAAVLVSILAAACTASTDESLQLAMPAYDAGAPPADVQQALAAEEGATLPGKVAFVPVQKPGGTNVAAAQAEAALESTQPAAAEPEQADAAAKTAGENKPAIAEAAPSSGQILENGGPILTAGTMPTVAPVKKKGFLSNLFSTTPAEAAAAPVVEPAAKAKPIIKLPANGEAEAKETERRADKPPLKLASLASDPNFNALPGVRTEGLFEIKRKSGLDDDSDVDLHEDEEGPPLILASAAGMARLAPNGLLKQRENVDVSCLKPNLVRLLKTVESHYRKKMIVTSGYRSPTYNRKVNGAKKSQHMYCAAVDVQIPGVSKWELARYVRSMPQRGGVGTYCHTESVHIDVGPERDWNWRCRRRG